MPGPITATHGSAQGAIVYSGIYSQIAILQLSIFQCINGLPAVFPRRKYTIYAVFPRFFELFLPFFQEKMISCRQSQSKTKKNVMQLKHLVAYEENLVNFAL